MRRFFFIFSLTLLLCASASLTQAAQIDVGEDGDSSSVATTTTTQTAPHTVVSHASSVSTSNSVSSLSSSSSVSALNSNDFTCSPGSGVKRSRFAYVMMHYEGTTKDDEYLLGLRVLIRSIQSVTHTHTLSSSFTLHHTLNSTSQYLNSHIHCCVCVCEYVVAVVVSNEFQRHQDSIRYCCHYF